LSKHHLLIRKSNYKMRKLIPIFYLCLFVSCDAPNAQISPYPKEQVDFITKFKNYSDEYQSEGNAIKQDSIGNKWNEYVDQKVNLNKWLFLVDGIDNVIFTDSAYTLKIKINDDFPCNFSYGFSKSTDPVNYNRIKQLQKGDTVIIDGKLTLKSMSGVGWPSCNIDIKNLKKK